MINTRLFALLLLAAAFAGQPALAGFKKSPHQVYVAWPGLSVEELPPQAEYKILAVVDPEDSNNPVIYIINYTYKDKTFPLGAFNCNSRFDILTSSTNGLYDIACARKDIFGQIEKTTLKAIQNGMYREQF